MALTAGLWVYVVIVGLLLLFSVLSNALYAYCVLKVRTLRNVTNLLIFNLAISDILLAGFVLPQKLHDISHTEWFYEGTILCKIVNFFPVFVITSSIYTLVCVSIERRRAISESDKQQITLASLYKIVPFLWIFSLLVSLPTLVEYSVNTITIETGPNTTRTIESCGSHQMSMGYSLANSVFVLLVSYIIPVVIMLKNYTQLAVFVWRKGREVGLHDVTQLERGGGASVNSQLFKSRIHIVKLLMVVAVIFALSWLPFFITLLYAKITQNDASNDASGFVNLFLIALATFSTAYNVVLYVIYNPSFSRAIKHVLRCHAIAAAKAQSAMKSPNGHNMRVFATTSERMERSFVGNGNRNIRIVGSD